MKILVVDDDLELLGLIGFALRQAGYLVIETPDGARALEAFDREHPDLAILDVNLPGLNGFELCERLRARTTMPIMMLTVQSAEEDEVRGLDLGADDYLTKPFSPRTLLARVRALLRRGEAEVPGGEYRERRYQVGEMRLEAENQTVSVGGRPPVRLTNLEFRLLQYLLINARRTIPSDRLSQHVWGYRGVGDRQALKQLVRRLRQKLELNPSQPQYVVTVTGIGYVLQLPDS